MTARTEIAPAEVGPTRLTPEPVEQTIALFEHGLLLAGEDESMKTECQAALIGKGVGMLLEQIALEKGKTPIALANELAEALKGRL